MINWLKALYFGDDLDNDLRVFNVVNTICVIGLLIMSYIVQFFFKESYISYIVLGMAVLFLLTMLEGNRTVNRKRAVLIVSCAFNFFFMPYLFFMFNKFVCVIPIYFIFGIIYTLVLLDLKTGTVLCTIEIVFYTVLLAVSRKFMPLGLFIGDTEVIQNTYMAGTVATIVSGVICGAAIRYKYICYAREQKVLDELKLEAMDAYIAKDMFLINMSHEIRTPMNAIVGTVDLLLDQNIDDHVSDYVYNILNSCNALLSITDELMDLSKADTGEIVVYVSRYDISELLMEITNMMTVRLMDSPIDLFIDINPTLPKYLYGDASKIRQIFINLMNNAVKYTSSGKITLRVDYEKQDDDMILLKADVEDTGCGIREEEIPKLFNRYVRAGEKDSIVKKVEGTGLGLLICKEILSEMKGSIDVKSSFGVGSVFSFSVPQRAETGHEIAKVEFADNNKVLVFEKNEDYSNFFKRILDNLSINSIFVNSKQEFARELSEGQFTHVFVSSEKFPQIQQYMRSRLNNEKFVVISKVDDNIDVGLTATVLTRPIYSVNISSVLNNETNTFVRDVVKKGGFACPKATILVVDDNYTNLNVARGLLTKYEANVLTAMSGKDCLRILDEQDVDMIFMDYMMPEMNGIDTLKKVRKMPRPKCKVVPTVALTANVVSGAREMFLDAGFDDFISKPISVDRMEKCLKKYLPKELIQFKN